MGVNGKDGLKGGGQRWDELLEMGINEKKK